MKERCIIIPAIKKNAVIPDQLVKRLAGVTLVERAINTARSVLPGTDIVVLTDSQEIALICERAGVGFRWNRDLHFTSLDIVAEMRGLLAELAAAYEHAVILRASCPLLTWVDVEDAWKKYCRSGADSLVTVKEMRQRLWNVRGEGLESLLSQDADHQGEQTLVVESRALIILRLALLRDSAAAPPCATRGAESCPTSSTTGALKSRAIRTGGSASTCSSVGTWSLWWRAGLPSAWGTSFAP